MERRTNALKDTVRATAMRVANSTEFYMAKCQSKPDEKLGPIMQPFDPLG